MSRHHYPDGDPDQRKALDALLRRLERLEADPLYVELIEDAGRRREDGTYNLQLEAPTSYYHFGSGRRRKAA